MKNTARGLAGILLVGSILGGCQTQGWKNFEREVNNLVDGGAKVHPGAGAAISSMSLNAIAANSSNPKAAAGGHAAADVLGNYGASQAREGNQITVNNYTGTGTQRTSGIDDYIHEHGGIFLSNIIDGNNNESANDPVDRVLEGDHSLFYNNSIMTVSVLRHKYEGKSVEMTLKSDLDEELSTQTLTVGRESDGMASLFKQPMAFGTIKRIFTEGGNASRVQGIKQYTVEVRAMDGSLPADVRKIIVDFEHEYK